MRVLALALAGAGAEKVKGLQLYMVGTARIHEL